jgi:hypothetical protein
MLRLLACSLSLVGVIGCARPDARTAVELERDARRHQAEALSARAYAERQQTILPPPTGPEAYAGAMAPFTGGPFNYSATGRVAIEEQTADDELATARRLRDLAKTACERLPVEARLDCPTGGTEARVEDIAGGVRITVPRAAAPTLSAQLECALARARVERTAEGDRCPLLVPRSSARVVQTPAGTALEIVAGDAVSTDEIRRRAHAPQ